MGYKYSFSNDETYSADDINEITRRLVTSGVEDPFTDGVPHNISCFNLLNSNMVTSGTVPETDTTLKVVKKSNTSVEINAGTAFFANGMTITVDVNKVQLNISAGVYNYIYLERDSVTGKAAPKSSVNVPTGDIVMLAHIDKQGNVIDKRAYAVGKLPKYISGYNLPKQTELTYNGPGTYNIDMKGNKYRYFIIKGCSYEYADTGIDSLCLWNVLDNTNICMIAGGGRICNDYTKEIPIRVVSYDGHYGAMMELSYTGNILTIKIIQLGTYPCTGKLEITAI